MKFVIKTAAYSIWLAAIGISAWLAWSFHDKQISIALSLAILSLSISAFGFLFARDAWRMAAYPEFFAGVALWFAGAGFFSITEWGYWDSSYSQNYAEYQQMNTARARQDNIKDRQWQALTTGQFAATSTQVAAQLNATKMSERFASTKGCTEATNGVSRDFCKGYFELTEKLAAAENREKLERQFSERTEEHKTKLIHNVLAGAEFIARRFSIDERRAADLVIFAAWILLFLGRDLGALVADPIGRRRQEKQPAPAKPAERLQESIQPLKLPEAPVVAQEPSLPPVRLPEAPKPDLDRIVSEVAKPTPITPGLEKIVGDLPKPMPTVALEPATVAQPVQESVSSEFDTSFFDGDKVHDLLTAKERQALIRNRKAKKKIDTAERSIIDWMSECTSRVERQMGNSTSQSAFDSYDAWRKMHKRPQITKNKLTRQLNIILKQEKTGEGRNPRIGQGAKFYGLLVVDPPVPTAQPLKARA